MSGLYYEGVGEGDTIRYDRRRTVSESDNQRFCDLTTNQQPLHLDAETTCGERVVTMRVDVYRRDDTLVCSFERTARVEREET